MKITIIGTGYVGLVTGTCFAEVGHTVICVDNDESKVKMLQGGGIPIYEPGLEEMVKKNVAEKRLSFTSSTAEGVANSDVIFIAVPTPPLPDGGVDLSFIERVARDIAGAMTSYKIIVDKSTVPVKTGEKVAETIKRYCKAKVEFDVVSNPEFLREGFAVEDLMHPDRVVIGVASPRPVAAMKEIYLAEDIDKAQIAIAAKAGLTCGSMTRQYVPNGPHPSILLASSSSLGMPRKNCLSRKMLKAEPKNAGTQSGRRLSTHPKERNIRN